MTVLPMESTNCKSVKIVGTSSPLNFLLFSSWCGCTGGVQKVGMYTWQMVWQRECAFLLHRWRSGVLPAKECWGQAEELYLFVSSYHRQSNLEWKQNSRWIGPHYISCVGSCNQFWNNMMFSLKTPLSVEQRITLCLNLTIRVSMLNSSLLQWVTFHNSAFLHVV